MRRIKETPNFDFTSVLPKTERSVQREQFWVYQYKRARGPEHNSVFQLSGLELCFDG